MININYDININVRNKMNDTKVTFTESKVHNTNLDHNSCHNKTFHMYKGNLYDLFDNRIYVYMVNNDLTYNDLEISDINVICDNEFVDIVINNNKENFIDFNVEILAFYHDKNYIQAPVITGEVISDSVVKIKTNSPNYAYKVFDENDNLIGEASLGSTEILEGNLESDTIYKRKVVAYLSNVQSNYSNLIVLKTNKVEQEVETFPIKTEYKKNNNIEEISHVDERLRAFKSGVGYGNDLKIYKPDDTNFINNFDVMANVYGDYLEKVNAYEKVSFDYRLVCIGKEDKEEINSYIKLRLSTMTGGSVKLRVYKYVTKSIDVKSMAKAKISYYANENGQQVPKILSVSTDEFRNTLDGIVNYNEENKTAYLQPYENTLITSTPIKTLIKNKALSMPGMSDTNPDSWEYFDFNILDDYTFNDTDDKYSPSKPRVMSTASKGTIYAHSSNSNTVDASSGLYLSGYSAGNLFDGEAIIEKTINTENDSILILSRKEIDDIVMTNISDRDYVYDGLAHNAHIKIEVIECSAGVKLSSPDLSSNDVITAKLNLSSESDLLQYRFDLSNRDVIIDTNTILNGIENDNNLIYDYKLNIIECSGNISCRYGDNQSEDILYAGQILNWEDSCYSKIIMSAKEEIVAYPYEDVNPPYTKDAFFGIVNNKTDSYGQYIKSDMVLEAPKFLIPDEIYDIKFKVIVNNISPENAHLKFNFYNQDDLGYTTINGDFIKFSSDATSDKTKVSTDLIATQFCERLNLSQNDISTLKKIAKITRPSIVVTNPQAYTDYRLSLYATSPDITLDNYSEEIIFDAQEIDVNYDLKVQKSSSSKWCPLIKNGYYYINQDEYYMYSNNNIDTNYEDLFEYVNKAHSYKIRVDLQSEGQVSEGKLYHIKDKTDFNNSDRILFENGYLIPKPIKDGIYYKEYENFEEVIKEIHFDTKVSAYNYLSWIKSNLGEEITVWVRSFDIENDTWSEWLQAVNNNALVLPLSYKMQIKLKFEPKAVSEQTTLQEIVSGYGDFDNEIDMEASQNVFILNGVIQTTGNEEECTFFSKILNFETETTLKLSTYYSVIDPSLEPIINIHIASSDNIDELINNPSWILHDGVEGMTGKYFRYRISFTRNLHIISLYKDITTLKTKTFPQGIKNLELSVTYSKSSETTKELYIDKSYNIDYDCKEIVVCKNVLEEIEYPVMSNGFNIEDIQNVSIINNDEESTLMNMYLSNYDLVSQDIHDVFNGWISITNTNHWMLDNNNKTIINKIPFNNLSGYICHSKYNNWTIECEVSSDSNKNPIGFILGHEVDSNNKEHTLTLLIGPNKKANQQNEVVNYSVYYNYGKEDQLLILDRSSTVNDIKNIGWSDLTSNIRVKAQRVGDLIKIYRSQPNNSLIDLNTLGNIDLKAHPQLMMFLNKSKFGLCCYNQKNSLFSNISISIDDVVNSYVTSTSRQIETLAVNSKYVEFVESKATMSPLPQQFSPITVESYNGVSFNRVYFVKNNKYVLTNEETFTDVFDNIKLQYSNIDIDTILVFVNDIDVTGSRAIIVKNNYMFFDKTFNEDDVVTIKYKIKDSFCVNYNINNNLIELELHTKETDNRYIVKYETNEFDSKSKINHLSLNPIYNTSYQGYIYLSHDEYLPSEIQAFVNPNYVYANGKDSVSICVTLLDAYKNPVIGEELRITTGYGRVITDSKITDINGVVTFKYISTISPCVDYITVEHTKLNLVKKIKINNLEV